jgi:16S rRNA (guanine(966)-N(2))-methyltransferase RsmD
MRIIAGTLKGRRLAAPTWPGLRPTADKLRETLFNILGTRVEGARVLDGFAGTGAVGIEALSRGAAHVTFVESDRRAAALVADNLRRTGLAEGYAIIRADLRTVALPRETFDLVLLDPPYDEADLDGLIGGMAPRLAPDGLLVLEHARRRAAPAESGGLVRRRVVASGDSALSFYARGAPAVEGAPEA